MESSVNHLTTWVVWGGFALAFVFGLIAARTNFCTMGAISDIVNMAHWGRMRMWLLAIAVALFGTTMLASSGHLDLAKTIYQRPALPWLSLLLGGLMFGVGMTMASGCANKNLIRLGGGSLRSLVVLAFMAIAAYMTLKGLFGQWRASLLDPVTIDLTALGLKTQSLAEVVARITGMSARTALLGTGTVLALGLAAFALKEKRFRSNTNQVVGGFMIGLLVAMAWDLTGHIGFGENPETLEMTYFGTNSHTLESMSFVAPIAYSLELLMLWTDKSLHVSFGIACALGVVLGSLFHALSTRSFRWEGFASFTDLRNHLVGAALMGFGGVTAMGCTVGQGITGVSTLAMGSFLALAGIIIGAVAMMRWQNRD